MVDLCLCCLQGTGTRFDFAESICVSFPFNYIGGDEEGGSGVQGGLSLLSSTHGRPGPRLGVQSLPGATILFSAIRFCHNIVFYRMLMRAMKLTL